MGGSFHPAVPGSLKTGFPEPGNFRDFLSGTLRFLRFQGNSGFLFFQLFLGFQPIFFRQSTLPPAGLPVGIRELGDFLVAGFRLIVIPFDVFIDPVRSILHEFTFLPPPESEVAETCCLLSRKGGSIPPNVVVLARVNPCGTMPGPGLDASNAERTTWFTSF